MERGMTRIFVALENQQAEHHTYMVDIEGMINNQPISILIDPGTNLSYISPTIVYLCKFVYEKFDKSWLVQLATCTKHKVISLDRNCKLIMNDFLMHVNINIIPLGSYDLLIGMDWLEEHKVVLNCFDKTLLVLMIMETM